MEEAAAKHRGNVVLILDFGSQYTHLITRRIRQLRLCSFCLAAGSSLSSIQALRPAVIILSGGPHSVHEDGAPTLPEGFFQYTQDNGIYVLGICYGLQLIVKVLGGDVKQAESQEYGKMQIEATLGSKLYGDKECFKNQVVWMSHGDEAVKLPAGFRVVARSSQGNIAGIENTAIRVYGLQYHPEVTHSIFGIETLKHILFEVAALSADWSLQDILEEQVQLIKEMAGTEDHAICALSGGVDSTVAATLVYKAIGDRLHCVFVDNGLLR